MPLYFFNVLDGHSHRDETGTELPDIYTAQAQAIRLSAEILREMGTRFWNGTEWKLEVTDDQGRTLFILRFSAEESITLADPRPDPPTP
jgi:hypothetical protein